MTTKMRFFIIYILFVSLGFTGCSSGFNSLKFKNGQTKSYNGAKIESVITYTNSVQLVKPAQTNKVQIALPVTISQPRNNTNLENITVTVPKEIVIILTVPASTNHVSLSGAIREKPIMNSGALFLYYLTAGIIAILGYYIWKRKAKKPNNKVRISGGTPIITENSN